MPRPIRCRGSAIGALVLLSMLAGWSAVRAEDAKAPDYEAIVAAPDRSDADRQTDIRRQPAKMLAFTGARPGMKVLDMGAGAGYSTELMARAVGPDGKVYAQESAGVMERVKDKFDIRAQSPAMKNVVHVIRNFDDPIPPDVTSLDLITFFFAYHDVTYMPVDRAEMNKKMFAALKPGGQAVTLEFIPNEDRVTPPTAAAFSLIMLANTDAGDAYTFSEYEKMFRNAGFRSTELRPIPGGGQSAILSRK